MQADPRQYLSRKRKKAPPTRPDVRDDYLRTEDGGKKRRRTAGQWADLARKRKPPKPKPPGYNI